MAAMAGSSTGRKENPRLAWVGWDGTPWAKDPILFKPFRVEAADADLPEVPHIRQNPAEMQTLYRIAFRLRLFRALGGDDK